MVARSFREDGQDISVIRPSVAQMLVRLIIALFILDSAYALLLVALLLQLVPDGLSVPFLLALWLMHTVKFALIIYVVIRLIFRWAGMTVLVLGEHLYVDLGVVKEDEQVYELGQLQEVKMHQTLLGKLLNYGNIVLTLGSRSFSEKVELSGIMDPAKHTQHFMQHLAKP